MSEVMGSGLGSRCAGAESESERGRARDGSTNRPGGQDCAAVDLRGPDGRQLDGMGRGVVVCSRQAQRTDKRWCYASTAVFTYRWPTRRPRVPDAPSDASHHRHDLAENRGVVAVDGLERVVVGEQPHLTLLLLQGLDGGLAVDHRGDDLAVLG